MRLYSVILCSILLSLGFACAPKAKPLTPLETLQTYAKAVRKKDITQMKLLMSQESLRMASESAQAEGKTVDDIVVNQTLFSESQTQVKYRNVREEGDKASIEVEDTLGIWNTIHLVKEDGVWKIDKKGFVEQIEKQSEQSNQELDNIINQGRIDTNTNTPPIANTNVSSVDNSNLETVDDAKPDKNTNTQP